MHNWSCMQFARGRAPRRKVRWRWAVVMGNGTAMRGGSAPQAWEPKRWWEESTLSGPQRPLSLHPALSNAASSWLRRAHPGVLCALPFVAHPRARCRRTPFSTPSCRVRACSGALLLLSCPAEDARSWSSRLHRAPGRAVGMKRAEERVPAGREPAKARRAVPCSWRALRPLAHMALHSPHACGSPALTCRLRHGARRRDGAAAQPAGDAWCSGEVSAARSLLSHRARRPTPCAGASHTLARGR